MIKGIHAMFYTPAADEMRAFLRDKLGLPFTDTGGGWLVFDPPEAEIGCHPSERIYDEISFYCDDIEGTVAALRERGVEFTSDVKDAGYALTTKFRLPGGHEAELYQPSYSKDRGRHVQ